MFCGVAALIFALPRTYAQAAVPSSGSFAAPPGAYAQAQIARAPMYFNRSPSGEYAEIIDSTAYLPLRYVCQMLAGRAVEWDPTARAAQITGGGAAFSMGTAADYMCVNGRYFYIKDKIFNKDGRMYVSARLLAKLLCMDIEWDSAARAVMLTAPEGELAPGDSYYDSTDLYWLSRIIYAESGGEPFCGQIAVGNVVLNRVADPDYPNSIYDVIFDRKYGVQFEPVANGTVYAEPSAEAVIAAKICLEGQNVAGGSIYFLNEQTAQSKWIVQNREFVKKIGNHTFYC